MISSVKHSRNSPSTGSILMLVLVAIVIMTLTTTSYLLLMRNEYRAAYYQGNHLQTELLAQSGGEYLRIFLNQIPTEIQLQGGLLNNPTALQDVLVIDDTLPSYRGRFSVVAPDISQGIYSGLRFGLENESAKLNLNSLATSDEITLSTGETLTARDRLLVIPGMTEMIADSILDWLDDDDTPRDYGAESAYYQALTPAYLPRNGPLAHLDELLLIQGVTPALLYGADVNRNFQLDTSETLSGGLELLDNTSGQLNRGLSAYLTVQSLEKNLNPSGEPKIDLNGEDLQTLHGELVQALGPAEANFVIAYRQFGPTSDNADGEDTNNQAANSGTTSADSLEIDFEKQAQNTIGSVLDLVDARVTITSEDDNSGSSGGTPSGGGRGGGRGGGGQSSGGSSSSKPPQVVESPWKNEPATLKLAFATLQDAATVDTGERTAGRININQASRPVLLTIPGMTAPVADQIVLRRDPAMDPLAGDQRHPTWLLTDGLVTLEELKPMISQLTTGGDIFSGQIVGYFETGTARARAAVLLDKSGDKTQLIGWQDLSKLGPGFPRSAVSSIIEPETDTALQQQ